VVLGRRPVDCQLASSSGESGSKNSGSDHQLAFQNTELSAAVSTSDRNQPNGIIAARNNNLLSRTRFFNESRQAHLRFANADSFHISRLLHLEADPQQAAGALDLQHDGIADFECADGGAKRLRGID
jgi:hypothetical protein